MFPLLLLQSLVLAGRSIGEAPRESKHTGLRIKSAA
jgi:hypothetical protein